MPSLAITSIKLDFDDCGLVGLLEELRSNLDLDVFPKALSQRVSEILQGLQKVVYDLSCFEAECLIINGAPCVIFEPRSGFLECFDDLVSELRAGDIESFILKHGSSPWVRFTTATVDEGAGGVESSAPAGGDE